MSIRAIARQNLLVATINTALERQLITLECKPFESTTFEFELAGMPVIARVHDISFDEISVKAVVCPTELGRKHIECVIWREIPEVRCRMCLGDPGATVGEISTAVDVLRLIISLRLAILRVEPRFPEFQ